MSREIKFRGKTYDGRWVIGDLSTTSKPNIYVFPSDGMDSPDTYLVIPETVGQFTGLRDDNGKEVYEGDVIQNLLGQKLIVEWNDNSTNAESSTSAPIAGYRFGY